MVQTERTERINARIDGHFKSNKGAWWVNNERGGPSVVTLHCGIGGDKIDPRWVALLILKTEPSVKSVVYNCWIYTRETLRAGGFKI